ncbi:MAG: hypothetical protein A2X49_00665 [Lentisphaerae bacterium GWF2_52_8]|nr:MAG: hypothetical protein A2X49_00665 [Lentisphaerae bacterium GWF2_52_8]
MDFKIFDSPLTRRQALQCGLIGTAGILFSEMLPFRAFAAEPAAAAAIDLPPAFGKARAVIQIWLWGGPSHLDTFDPKPGAGQDYCGPYNKPIATNVDGIQICQMLPLLAKQADKYSLLRGMTHGNNGHETAAYLVQTGRKSTGGLVFPGIGAIVSYFKGYNGGYKGMLPPYITVTTPQGRFAESGFLGSAYKPFATGSDPNKEPFAVEGIISENISEMRQIERRALLGDFDSFARESAGNATVRALEKSQEQAYSMILGEARKAFILSEEKSEQRDLYGRSKFGQSCLVARRLVERGVPYVTINHGGWDTHKEHFSRMNKMLPELDKGLATLLKDLSDHGLLDNTIVWVGGEFGRTPKIDWDQPWNGGRGHYGKAFSHLVAGGGFKGGKIVGETDGKGENVSSRPVYPCDLLGSMMELLGIDPKAKLPHPQGRDIFVSPFAANEISAKESGGLLREIM